MPATPVWVCSAACHTLVPATSTGATTGSTRSGRSVSRTLSPAASATVEHAGTREPRRPGNAGRDERPHVVDVLTEQQDRSGSEHELEDHQLGEDGRSLPEEDAGRIEAREAQAVARAVRALDREGSLDGEQAREEHRHPEHSGGGPQQVLRVGTESEREQHEHDGAERCDLVDEHSRPHLYAKVLARDESRVTPHWGPRESARSRTLDGCDRGTGSDMGTGGDRRTEGTGELEGTGNGTGELETSSFKASRSASSRCCRRSPCPPP